MDPTDFVKIGLGGRLPERKLGRTGAQRRGRFVRGPIPWDWICRAARLPGAALPVSVALWLLSGIRTTRTVSLGNAIVAELGVERHAKYRALARLEAAGLVFIERHPGRNPRVTLVTGERTP
jgi:hypothetical protein